MVLSLGEGGDAAAFSRRCFFYSFILYNYEGGSFSLLSFLFNSISLIMRLSAVRVPLYSFLPLSASPPCPCPSTTSPGAMTCVAALAPPSSKGQANMSGTGKRR
jgi:hypothetical protein